MKIQVLSAGNCSKCSTMVSNVNEAIKDMKIEIHVEKVTDINKIIAYGVMSTPALAVDGKVLSSGRILGVDRIKELIQGELE